jgi:hypothetical protein
MQATADDVIEDPLYDGKIGGFRKIRVRFL